MNIGILGSTGSIGRNALEVIENLNKNDFKIKVTFLSVDKNIDILSSQVKSFNPVSVFIKDEESYNNFRKRNLHPEPEIFNGEENLLNLIKRDNYDLLIVSVVGFSGLKPTIEAIKSKKRIALANKETLVVAGRIINELLDEYNTELLPIDSEHSAILQCLTGENGNDISKIILTASGGPFRNKSLKELENVTIQQALNHPNWSMGNKITIDSATMMNKGLEIIEAKWIFKQDISKIQVLIHPQSIIHSLVEFTDGSIKAQLGIPDMKIPIQYAITHPARIHSDFPKVNFSIINSLTFEEPDTEKFECLRLAYFAAKEEGTYPIVLNASNEIAVNLFLNGKIKFTQIPEIVKKTLNNHKSIDNFETEHIYEIDRTTREDILKDFMN
ncbi:MAG: 1-deoxy-D-xylulose-5-phosphate reductoisomerase [Ignavibacteria bacterium]|nr:1-deoxy-D-xylulose-5-phosphate reductoisomerase [Ignavibacteria bacterium]